MTESLLQLQVQGFESGGRIPAKFATVAGGGENLSPGVSWVPLPAAQSYAILLDDIHPVANYWVHWLVVDIPNTITAIEEGASGVSMPEGCRELMTSWGAEGYGGPQPPIGSGDHEYVMRLYALDIPRLDLVGQVSRADFIKAIERHAITTEVYSGFFERRA